jgi:DNA mismatch repair protein MutS
MRQYLDLKERHPDALLFFRCGDFYEMFFEDAVIAARALDLVLTSRDKGKEDSVPMCGVPYHAARGYLAKLTELGHKVAVCEQMEDPKLAKGLVKREVVRVITPGVVLDDDVLDPKLPRYLAALVPAERRSSSSSTAGASSARASTAGASSVGASSARASRTKADDMLVGLAYLDATTGDLYATELSLPAVLDELIRVAPREIVVDAKLLGGDKSPLTTLQQRYRVPWNTAQVPSLDDASRELRVLGGDALGDRPHALRAAATVVGYAKATQPIGTLPITKLVGYEASDAVVLDETAIANLELVETIIGRRAQGSLLDIIDQTVTAPGGRRLRRWLLYPLVDVAHIRRRQDAVGWLVERPALTEQVRKALGKIADLERLAGKATLGVATPRDLGRLRDALLQLPDLVELVRSGATQLDPLPDLLDLRAAIDPALPGMAARLGRALVDEPPYVLKDGGVIRAAYDATVDECRRLADGGKDEILAIETREQKDSGIANLKVRYNRVFGYYIEITKTHLAKVPAHYIRKQTIATGERYVTPELAELEKKVLTAEETLATREAELFRAEVIAVAEVAAKISAAGAALAILDACASLAEVAAKRGYCRPVVDDGLVIELVDARHPVIEAMLPPGSFVPNDCRLDAGDIGSASATGAAGASSSCDPPRRGGEQLVLITGPNMAGKSTYMRQVAQIALLAQIGSFVPAKSATIGICDRVFTRVGAADNLSRGDSTFMVEMREAASILAKATKRSLIILDEVGRGTSTFDGVSIAWAMAEHLHDVIGARTLFATHYHELVALADSRPRVRNVSVAVREHKNEIVFLRRVVPGGANKSYGIDVARLAGLPRQVVGRAREIMAKLEGGNFGLGLGATPQLSLGIIAPHAAAAGAAAAAAAEAASSRAIDRLHAIDVERTTPLEALQLLAELKALL